MWLDATGLEQFAVRFPTIAADLAAIGLDPAVDWLPVAPAAHHQCGGIVTDLDGATSLPGLWAAGEVSCTGVHGANRLASNSLLEGMVFAARVVEAVDAGRDGPEPTGAMRAVLDPAVSPSQEPAAAGAGEIGGVHLAIPDEIHDVAATGSLLDVASERHQLQRVDDQRSGRVALGRFVGAGAQGARADPLDHTAGATPRPGSCATWPRSARPCSPPPPSAPRAGVPTPVPTTPRPTRTSDTDW